MTTLMILVSLTGSWFSHENKGYSGLGSPHEILFVYPETAGASGPQCSSDNEILACMACVACCVIGYNLRRESTDSGDFYRALHDSPDSARFSQKTPNPAVLPFAAAFLAFSTYLFTTSAIR